ncbi:MAG: hypothetical protein JXI33_08915 [Candidatus Aminicenantes bacterium]|nr:hypothetical protein [Candidatus Aminicenantes bacterium]
MKRTLALLICLALGSGFIFSQSFNFKIGLFNPSLKSDLWQDNMQNLAFNKTDMLNTYYAAEYEIFLNRFTSFSLEIGKYSKDVYSQYKDYTDQDGSPIFQNISLSITPIEANIKLYPFGHRKMVYPFFGAGLGLYAWTYQQWGDFIIFPGLDIENGFAETETFSVGFNCRAGLVFRFHHRVALTFEGKYQYVRGQLSGYFEGFEMLDLGGITATVGVHFFLR